MAALAWCQTYLGSHLGLWLPGCANLGHTRSGSRCPHLQTAVVPTSIARVFMGAHPFMRDPQIPVSVTVEHPTLQREESSLLLRMGYERGSGTPSQGEGLVVQTLACLIRPPSAPPCSLLAVLGFRPWCFLFRKMLLDLTSPGPSCKGVREGDSLDCQASVARGWSPPSNTCEAGQFPDS